MRRGRPLRPALAGWRLGAGALAVLAAPFLIVFLLLAEFGVLIDDDADTSDQTLTQPPTADEPTLVLDDADAVAQDLTVQTEQPTAAEQDTADSAGKPDEGQVYTVVPGDTLALIAFRHATTVRAIAAYNEIVNVDRLDVGQQIRIPPPGYEPPPDAITNADAQDGAATDDGATDTTADDPAPDRTGPFPAD